VLILVYGISAGTRTIAGDEDAGILDAVLAHPISRTRLALQRFAAFAASVLVVAAIFWLAMLALAAPARLEGISVGQFAAMHVQLALFAILFGAIAFGVGAAFGRRVLALVVGAAVAVWGFVADGIISQVDGLEWIENLSPFHWLTGGEPLRNGFQMGDAALMLLLTLLFVAAGTWAFNRRDVAV
jgi:ABC-2 type transport system permease protein